MIANPPVSPMAKPMMKNTSDPLAPTAASALMPMVRPTIMVSTME